MRFERLELVAFGHFTDRVLEFGDGAPDLHVIYGANEAGKSTTLAAISDLLFGVETHSRYGFLHGYKTMALGALGATVAVGDQRLAFRRRKGNANTLLDAAGQPLDDGRLAALLGPVDRGFFSGMFGLDHTGLRKGGADILSAEGDLGQSLFQAGAAIRDLHQLLGRLDGEAADLFTPLAQKRRLNGLLADFKTARARIGQEGLKGDDWKERRRQRDAVAARLAEIDTERRDLSRRLKGAERIRRVLPLLANSRNLAAELAELATTPLLPESAAEDRRQALGERQACGRGLAEANAAIERIAARRAAISADESVLAMAEEVARLTEQRGAVRKAMDDLPKRKGEKDQLDAAISGALRELGSSAATAAPTSVTRAARAILPARPAVAELRALITEAVRLEAEHAEASRQRDEAAALATRLDEDLAGMPVSPDAAALKACLVAATARGRLDELAENAEAALARHRDALAARLAALTGWSGNEEDLARLPVPEAATVLAHGEAINGARAALEDATSRNRAASEALGRVEADRAGLDAGGPVATEAAVHAARRRRDDGWRLIRRRHVDGQAVDDSAFTAGQPLVDCFESAVAEADGLSDRVRSEAQRAARQAELARRHQEARHQAEAVAAELALATDKLAAAEAAWLALWRPAGLAPQPPNAMLAWLTTRRDCLTLATQQAEARDAALRLGRQLDEAVGGLARACADAAIAVDGLGYAALLARASGVAAELERATAARHALEQRRATARQEARAADERLGRAASLRQAWQGRWTRAVAAIGAAADASPAAIEAMLEVLDRLAQLVPQSEDLGHRIAAMEADIALFEAGLGLLAKGGDDLSPLAALAELAKRVRAAEEADQQSHTLDQQLTEAETAEARARDGLAAADAVLDRLCRQAGCAEPDQLEQAEARSARRRAAEAERHTLERQIVEQGDGAGLAEIQAEAEAADRDEVLAVLDATGMALETVAGEADRLRLELGEHDAALKAMDGAAGAAAAAEEAERLAADIHDEAERYIRLRLGHALLAQAVDSYRRRHQGPLLERAGALFNGLTLGAFAGLDTGFDERDRPILRALRRGGTAVEVAGLSEGTRDQLFLALRLAAIHLHLDSGRVLPFVADDLLIHFDDERAAAALEALAALAERTQVLFFTHNRHLVDLARARLPTERCRVVDL